LGVATPGLIPAPPTSGAGRWWRYLMLALGLTAVVFLVVLVYRRRRPSPA
jgi:hypothetical protein